MQRTIATLAVVLLLIAGVSTPARADYVQVCKGYDACEKAGYSHAGYKAASGTAYWGMYAGHNCTNYVAYRLVKNGMSNSRPWSGDGNAYSWGRLNPSKTDNTPKVGSVAWWDANKPPALSAGHVAYVERVVSSTEIWVSEDNWGGDFYWRKITKSGSGWPSGFIHFKDVKLTATKVPAISGTPRVGVKLSASSGTWTPSGASFKYQWLADGASISGATSSAFTPAAGHVGKQISVRVTASKSGHDAVSSTSTKTAKVAPGALSSTAAPSVSGLAKLGETLVAQVGTWSPAPDHTSVVWFADGEAISGATKTTFTPSDVHVGRQLSVRVTASRAGYTTSSITSASTSKVAPGTFSPTARPTISGMARLGATLTADVGSWSPAPSSTTVQWLADGVAITGATAKSLVLTESEVGSAVSVRVTASRAGYESASQVSAATAKVEPGTLVVRAHAAVSGDPKIGRWLNAITPDVSPAPTAISYQWLRRGAPVAGATGSAYKLAKGDVGKELSVRVSVSRSGYTSTSSTSPSTTPVRRAKAKVKVSSPKSVRASRTATIQVEVTSSGLKRSHGTVRLVLSGPSRVTKTVVLKKKHANVVSVKARGLKPGSYKITASFKPTKAMAKYSKKSKSPVRTLRVR